MLRKISGAAVLAVMAALGSATAQTPPVPEPSSATPQAPTILPAKGALAAAINAQDMAPTADTAATRRQIIRAQVLLDRRHFSPGVIDGVAGRNLRSALTAFQQAEGLPPTGRLDARTWAKLTEGEATPVLRGYVIVAADVEGPFAAPIEPGDFTEMASRPAMTWESSAEWLAERAHMDEALLRTLNPGVDFNRSGIEIVVADTARKPLPEVASIRVNKAGNQLRAMDADGKLIAAYPATVGSAERPAPTGTYAVRTVAPAPNYTFDPDRVTFKAKDGTTEKLTIPPGPNNPVGLSWIDLTLDTYGIHGTPHPRLIGKAASNGCVRLTNWDAEALANAVKAGTKVTFTS